MWRAAVVMVAAAAGVVSGLFLEPLSVSRETALDKVVPAGVIPFTPIQRAPSCPCASSVSGDYDPHSLNSLLPVLKHLYRDSHCKTLASLISTHIGTLEDARGYDEGIPFPGVSDVALEAVDRALIMCLREEAYPTHGLMEYSLVNPKHWHSQLKRCHSIARRSPVLSNVVCCLYACLQRGVTTILQINLARSRDYAHILKKREAPPDSDDDSIESMPHIGNTASGSILEDHMRDLLASKKMYEPNFYLILEFTFKFRHYLEGSREDFQSYIPDFKEKFKKILLKCKILDSKEVSKNVKNIIDQMDMIQIPSASRKKRTGEIFKLMSKLFSLDCLLTKDLSKKQFSVLKKLVDAAIEILRTTECYTPRNNTVALLSKLLLGVSNLGSINSAFDYDRILNKLKVLKEREYGETPYTYDVLEIMLYLLSHLQTVNGRPTKLDTNIINKYIAQYFPDGHPDKPFIRKELQSLVNSKKPWHCKCNIKLLAEFLVRVLNNLKKYKVGAAENFITTLNKLKKLLPSEKVILNFLILLGEVTKGPYLLEDLPNLQNLLNDYGILLPLLGKEYPELITEQPPTLRSINIPPINPNGILPTFPAATMTKLLLNPFYLDNTTESKNIKILIKGLEVMSTYEIHYNISLALYELDKKEYSRNPALRDLISVMLEILFSLQGSTDKVTFDVHKIQDDIKRHIQKYFIIDATLQKYINDNIEHLRLIKDEKLPSKNSKYHKVKFILALIPLLQETLRRDGGMERLLGNVKQAIRLGIDEGPRERHTVPLSILQMFVGIIEGKHKFRTPSEIAFCLTKYDLEEILPYVAGIGPDTFYNTDIDKMDTRNIRKLFYLIHILSKDKLLFNAIPVHSEINNRIKANNFLRMAVRNLVDLVYSIQGTKGVILPRYDTLAFQKELWKAANKTFPQNEYLASYIKAITKRLNKLNEQEKRAGYFYPTQLKVMLQIIDLVMELHKNEKNYEFDEKYGKYDIKGTLWKLKMLPSLKNSQLGLDVILLLHDLLKGVEKFTTEEDVLEALEKHNLDQLIPYFSISTGDHLAIRATTSATIPSRAVTFQGPTTTDVIDYLFENT